MHHTTYMGGSQGHGEFSAEAGCFDSTYIGELRVAGADTDWQTVWQKEWQRLEETEGEIWSIIPWYWRC